MDFKFISLEDIDDKVEDPLIMWEHENALSSVLDKTKGVFPAPDPRWIEERFWIWIHYAAAKIGRGELFETLDFLGFLRNAVLGPLILERNNARPQGVRKIETYATEEQLQRLERTVATYTNHSCVQALREVIGLYKDLRSIAGNPIAEKHAIEYVDLIASKTSEC